MGIKRRKFLQLFSAVVTKPVIPSFVPSISVDISDIPLGSLSSFLGNAVSISRASKLLDGFIAKPDAFFLAHSIDELIHLIASLRGEFFDGIDSWAELLEQHELLEKIQKYNPKEFPDIDALRSRISWMAQQPEFSGINVSQQYELFRSRIASIFKEHSDLFEEFDWVAFANDTHEPIEAVYQLLLQIGDDLPAPLHAKITAAYAHITSASAVSDIERKAYDNRDMYQEPVESTSNIDWVLKPRGNIGIAGRSKIFSLFELEVLRGGLVTQRGIAQNFADMLKTTYGDRYFEFKILYDGNTDILKMRIYVDGDEDSLHDALNEICAFSYALENKAKFYLTRKATP